MVFHGAPTALQHVTVTLWCCSFQVAPLLRPEGLAQVEAALGEPLTFVSGSPSTGGGGILCTLQHYKNPADHCILLCFIDIAMILYWYCYSMYFHVISKDHWILKQCSHRSAPTELRPAEDPVCFFLAKGRVEMDGNWEASRRNLGMGKISLGKLWSSWSSFSRF